MAIASGLIAAERPLCGMKGRSLVARNVRQIRVAKGSRKNDLPSIPGLIAPTSVASKGEAENPTVDLLDRLADTLGIPLAELFLEAGRTNQARSA